MELVDKIKKLEELSKKLMEVRSLFDSYGHIYSDWKNDFHKYLLEAECVLPSEPFDKFDFCE